MSNRAPFMPFQARISVWMQQCFGPVISADKLERNDRFLEEALELTQASGYDEERAHALVDYVFGRPQGDINQEVGGVMVTLAAHCLAHGVEMDLAGEDEYQRISTPETIEKIRTKQAGKPTGSALPIAQELYGDVNMTNAEVREWIASTDDPRQKAVLQQFLVQRRGMNAKHLELAAEVYALIDLANTHGKDWYARGTSNMIDRILQAEDDIEGLARALQAIASFLDIVKDALPHYADKVESCVANINATLDLLSKRRRRHHRGFVDGPVPEELKYPGSGVPKLVVVNDPFDVSKKSEPQFGDPERHIAGYPPRYREPSGFVGGDAPAPSYSDEVKRLQGQDIREKLEAGRISVNDARARIEEVERETGVSVVDENMLRLLAGVTDVSKPALVSVYCGDMTCVIERKPLVGIDFASDMTIKGDDFSIVIERE